MIEIFKLHDEIKFFQQIAYKKLRENKPRDVVLIYEIFPRVLEQFESCADFEVDEDEASDTIHVRHYLMRKLIQQNDITTARILMQTQEDRIFLVHCQYKQIKNTKKAALLIKEFNIDLDTIYKEFAEIENKILNDCMTFYVK